jgi:hypothetical protein
VRVELTNPALRVQPQLGVMWLPTDHLAAGRPGKCTPLACMADNDLGLGRIVPALSHRPYWKDTVISVVEDDAQAGPDHTDSHTGGGISPFNTAFIITTQQDFRVRDLFDDREANGQSLILQFHGGCAQTRRCSHPV